MTQNHNRSNSDLIASQSPDKHVDYYNQGLDFQKHGYLDKAIQCYQKALAIKPDLPEASYNMGIAYLDLSCIDAAVTCFKLAVELKPDYADAYNNLGNAYRDKEDIHRAISCYRQAIKINPQNPRPYYNLGNAYLELDEQEVSKACFQRALALKPDYATVFNSLGNSSLRQGDLELALANFSKAIEIQPDFAEAYYNRGNVQREMGRCSAAMESYREAVRLRKDYHEAYNNFGNLLKDLGNLEAASDNYRLAINARPDFAEAHFNLGNIMLQERQMAAAIERFKQAIALKPTYAEAHSNTGNACKELGRYQDALQHYNRALYHKPDLAEANFNRSLIHLLHQDFQQGWEGFEWRFKLPDAGAVYPHRFKVPRWDGSNFKGRRLLVHCEQGFGDTLQFIRYLPMVKKLGGSVIFETRKELMGILKKVPGMDSLIQRSPDGNHGEPFDYHIPLMSLPGVFQTRLETIPSHTPYILADDRKLVKWRRIISGQKPEFKIGIVWAGRPGHTNDHNRSCGMDVFLPLSQIPGVQLFSLQKGEGVARLKEVSNGGAIVNLGERLVDFEDTAGAIANLDLIVSVDTAVAHLAGAMGNPVWLLLPFVPDWRWLLNRTDTPWYPTMRLFRQPEAGDWHTVFRNVSESLKELPGLLASGQANS